MSEIVTRRREWVWMLCVAAAFALVYGCSQAFVYVEGDDASTAAYHALGRDASILPPYSSYNGMLDFMLTALPAREPVVRITAMMVSSVASVIFVLLVFKLVFGWMGRVEGKECGWVVLVVLLAIPELFYFGLVYTPNIIAMCWLLGAHLVLRRGLIDRERTWPTVGTGLLSLALYGFGVACRWETAAYGIVIVMDAWLGMSRRQLVRPPFGRLALGFVWGGLALLSAFCFIVVSGYGLADLRLWLEMSAGASSGYYDTSFSLFEFAGRHVTFFTPIGVILALLGLYRLVRSEQALLVKALIGFLPLLPLFYRGAPKLLLPAVPGLVLCMVRGFELIWSSRLAQRQPVLVRASIWVVALLPWVLGMRIESPDTQWGPGFEVRTSGRGDDRGLLGEDNRDRRIGITSMRVAWWDAFAVATPEGPRSVGGFGAVLLGGGWRGLVTRLDLERRQVIERAIEAGWPILQDDGNAFITVHLLEMGYTTTEPRKDFRDGLNRRTFVNGAGRKVEVVQLQNRPTLFESDQLSRLIVGEGIEEAVLYSNYSSSLKKLYQIAPGSVEALGPFSAVLDLGGLREAVIGEQAASVVPGGNGGGE